MSDSEDYDEANDTDLRRAIKDDNLELVRELIANDVSILEEYEGNHDLVVIAMQYTDDDEMATLLVNSGADISNSKYIMYHACNNGYIDLVRLLLDKYNEQKITPKLKYAIRQTILGNDLEIAQLFIDQGISLNILFPDFWDFVDAKMSPDMLRLIATKDDIKDFINKNNILYNLLRTHNIINIPLIIETIKFGADLSEHDYFGNTLLHYAIDTKSIELITLMLDLGADRNIKNKNGVSALMRAKNRGPKYKEIYELMLTYYPTEIKEPDEYM